MIRTQKKGRAVVWLRLLALLVVLPLALSACGKSIGERIDDDTITAGRRTATRRRTTA